MKNYLFTMGLLCIALSVVSCNDDKDALPSSKTDFEQMVNGVYYQYTGVSYLQKEGEKWVETPYYPFVGDMANSLRKLDSFIWFKDGEIIGKADLGSQALDSAWNASEAETKLYVSSSFRYDANTGELASDKQILPFEKAGSHNYIENVTNKDLTIRREMPQTDQRIYAFREHFSVYLSPDLSAAQTYRIFDSNEEAIAYAKKVLEETDK